ncbi:MAG: 50S ribosomal protein L23 [Armatimonadetes bacterium]|nr:50S ribosomal protein L23 [Armatimonadota bacterium]
MKLAAEQIILRPALTEKSEILKQDGKYVFFVSPEANRIEVAQAIEVIYNRGKKKEKDHIKVEKVNMITVHGKAARSGFRTTGRRADRKKAIITLAEGQILEDIGA